MQVIIASNNDMTDSSKGKSTIIKEQRGQKTACPFKRKWANPWQDKVQLKRPWKLRYSLTATGSH